MVPHTYTHIWRKQATRKIHRTQRLLPPLQSYKISLAVSAVSGSMGRLYERASSFPLTHTYTLIHTVRKTHIVRSSSQGLCRISLLIEKDQESEKKNNNNTHFRFLASLGTNQTEHFLYNPNGKCSTVDPANLERAKKINT